MNPSQNSRELAQQLHKMWCVHSGTGHKVYLDKAATLIDSYVLAQRTRLYELVDEFRSGAAEYDVRGAEHWESAKADVYNECADKLRDAIAATK